MAIEVERMPSVSDAAFQEPQVDDEFDFDQALEGLNPSIQKLLRAMDRNVSEDSSGGLQFQQFKIKSDQKIRGTVYDLLAKENLYAYSEMRVEIGKTEMPLSYDHLGLKAETKKKLEGTERQENGKQVKLVKPGRYVIFPALVYLKNKIEYRRKKIQDKMLFDGSNWLCGEKDWIEVEREIQAWKDFASEEVAKVLAGYRQSKQKYMIWLAGWLESVNETLEELGEDQLDVACELAAYEHKFPSYDQLAENIRIIIVGPKPIMSLARHAEHNRTIAEELERLEQAQYSRDQIEIARRALERDAQAKNEAIARGAMFIESRVFKAIEDLLALAQAKNLTERRKERIQDALKEIDKLMQLPGASALSDLMESSTNLAGLCNQAQTRREEISERIAELQSKIENVIEARPIAAGDGSRFAPMRMKININSED